MYMDVKAEGKGSRDARAELLNFYDLLAIHPEFSTVDKGDFMEVKRRYRNDKKKRKIRNDDVLKDKFCSLGSVPQKKDFSKGKSSNKAVQKLSSQSDTSNTNAENQGATNGPNEKD